MTFHVNAQHQLERAPESLELRHRWDKVPSYRITPVVVVVHYGVTRTQSQLESALAVSDYVSAHIAMSARGNERVVTQMVPFNVRAAHAGAAAVYRGRSGVNSFSLGIEINNPGPLFETPDGWADIRGKLWDGEVLVADHPSGRFPKWQAWARYTQDEIAVVTALCLAFVERYPTIVDVVGHDEIRTDKADPGPAFPVAELRSLLFHRTQMLT